MTDLLALYIVLDLHLNFSKPKFYALMLSKPDFYAWNLFKLESQAFKLSKPEFYALNLHPQELYDRHWSEIWALCFRHYARSE